MTNTIDDLKHSKSNAATDLNPQDLKSADSKVGSTKNVTKSEEKKWQFSSNELKSALNTWQELSQTEAGLSPDEQMLQDVQKLLKDLKDKIKEFSDN